MRSLNQEPLTEDALIAAIEGALGNSPRALRVGIGDDAAVWKPHGSHLSLITTDMLIDGVHFRSESTTPAMLGTKALAKSLSDVAAMGGRPVVATIAFGITGDIDVEWVRAFYRGMAALAARSHCAIAGGDIVRAPSLTFAVTIVGEARRSSLRLRSGAKPGDVVAVSGPLGLGAAGLRVAGTEFASEAARAAGWYLAPAPRLPEGRFFGSRRAVHALMDLSDGLSSDLARMARASGVDAIVEASALYVHSDVQAIATREKVDPLEFVLNGGDDYELLAAIERRASRHVAHAFSRRFGRPLVICGRFVKGDGRVWIERDGRREALPERGYDHLRNQT